MAHSTAPQDSLAVNRPRQDAVNPAGSVNPSRSLENRSFQGGPFSIRRPVRAAGPASVHRLGGKPDIAEGSDSGGAAPLRVVGPGRKERGYLQQIARLEQENHDRGSALEAAALVERGTERYVDRLEERGKQDRERLQQVQAQGNRLLVTLGAMQRENERLRQDLQGMRGRLEAPTTGPVGLVQRLGRLLIRLGK